MASVQIYFKGIPRLRLESLRIGPYTLVGRNGLPPPLVNGVYNIEELDSAEFGAVARALDPLGLPRTITLLESPHRFDETEFGTNLFMREIRLVNERPYKHILPILDYGTVLDGHRVVAYYVSQYVAGLNLRSFANELTPLRNSILRRDVLRSSLRAAMSTIISDVLMGLVEMHASSIVHLDIKPQNIVVYPPAECADGTVASAELRERIEAGDLNAFIVNLLGAKPIGPEVTGRTALRWTPYFFPPLFDELAYEHLDGGIDREALRTHGHAIDLYSFGRTLEVIFLDRIRRATPYFNVTPELASREPEKEAFWTIVFGDRHISVLERLVDRLLSLTGGFGSATNARHAFATFAVAATPEVREPNEVIMPTPRATRMRVFLCHASDDKPRVRDLSSKLKTDGLDVWIDEEALLPGENWREAISKAVRSSHVVVVCLSEAAVTKRGYIQKEIRLALDAADEHPEGAIFLIPARLEECEIPTQLSKWQWTNLFGSDGYARLMRSLRARAEELGLAIDK